MAVDPSYGSRHYLVWTIGPDRQTRNRHPRYRGISLWSGINTDDLSMWFMDAACTTKPCGSWPASDSGGSGNDVLSDTPPSLAGQLPQ